MKLFKKNQYPKYLAEENLTVGKQIFIFFWEIFKVVVISLAIIVPVRYFLIKPFYVLGASMEPNFYDHEYLIIDELTYRLNEPQRGDTIVFRYPFQPSEFFIKRIIGLPGEMIKISGGNVNIFNQVSPDGEVLREDYLLPAMKTLGEVEVKLGPDEYYLLGDNRIASLDSRAFGPVKRQYIIGRTLLRAWPLGRAGLLTDHLDYSL